MTVKRCAKCGKKCYPSERTAREAVRRMGNTVRVYRCGSAFHVTAERIKMTGNKHKRFRA